MMLNVALKFEKAFERYADENDKFLSYFEEKENDKKRIGPPSSSDWECASIFVKFLSSFYEVTLKFSGTLHITSNNFFHELCEIDSQLSYLASNNGSLLYTMATKMKSKYDKYWGDPDRINPMLFLAVVLDPRYKLKYLKFCFEPLYDAQTVAKLVVKVEQILHQLYNQYSQGGKDGDEAIKLESPPKNDSKESQRKRLLESFLQQQQMDVPENMNDVDRYFVDGSINPKTPSFDVLLWWKDNTNRYSIFSMIVRDVLAIPISTVASESAFSTSGRILDSFRSSLSPKMVEALVCTQSWLKENNKGIQISEFLDEISSYDFLEEDKLKENATSESGRSKTVVLD
ncbi:zinc finger BED domain-containing protein RICESLEEPER 1-like [Cynara cardunculus var. scolymus]|uniref:zinc finger BED domain-containing protein RICESLEEPER 1-like n=1 Tax=Cynara cardunculus var. scolymus TaxID=59895 RepID=UPI000D62FF26|nr:zinc finger BED domain-containing protein RICESLEEPER 1-like [Cynara cardunculus var. scolymus]